MTCNTVYENAPSNYLLVLAFSFSSFIIALQKKKRAL